MDALNSIRKAHIIVQIEEYTLEASVVEQLLRALDSVIP